MRSQMLYFAPKLGNVCELPLRGKGAVADGCSEHLAKCENRHMLLWDETKSEKKRNDYFAQQISTYGCG
jgi:hypothetical protein